MNLPIAVLSAASRELQGIRSYYSEFGEVTADRVLQDITDAFLVISTFPTSGRVIKGGLRRRVSVRHRFVKTYRVLPDRVEIINVYRYQNRTL